MKRPFWIKPPIGERQAISEVIQSKSYQMFQKALIGTIIVGFIMSIVFALIIMSGKTSVHHSTTTNQLSKPSITPPFTTVGKSQPQQYADILTGLAKKLHEYAPIQDSVIQWIVTYQNFEPLTGKSFKMHEDTANNTDAKVAQTAVKNRAMEPIFDSYFLSEGFSKADIYSKFNNDNRNTNNVSTGYGFVVIYGYTKGDIKCLIQLTAEYYQNNNTYFCGIIDQNQLALDRQFSPALISYHHLSLPSNEENVIYVDKSEGNFASGTENTYQQGIPLASGDVWIAVKINGTWKVIGAGQDYPLCTEIDMYKIPRDIYGNCYTSSGIRRFNTQ